MSNSCFRVQVRSKIWLEIDGEPVFGQGREELLRLIQKGRSINAAAKAMGIPYRKAWTYIDAMEKRLGFPLVNRQKESRRRGIIPDTSGSATFAFRLPTNLLSLLAKKESQRMRIILFNPSFFSYQDGFLGSMILMPHIINSISNDLKLGIIFSIR